MGLRQSRRTDALVLPVHGDADEVEVGITYR
jgi:hypothetical protein